MEEKGNGWSWFTKHKSGAGNESGNPDQYPPLTQQSNGVKASKLEFAKAAGKGLILNSTRTNIDLATEQATAAEKTDVNRTVEGMKTENEAEVREEEEEEEEDDGDDAYHNLRKDAIKVSRLMRRHARSAANAYQVGEHGRAKQLSRQLRQERAEAAKLNARAAESIVKLRNGTDLWTVDLHGLHAAEAVSFLHTRLSELESSSRVITLKGQAGRPLLLVFRASTR